MLIPNDALIGHQENIYIAQITSKLDVPGLFDLNVGWKSDIDVLWMSEKYILLMCLLIDLWMLVISGLTITPDIKHKQFEKQ